VSISGPTKNEPIIKPMAWAMAMLPFCFGVSE
jgi:hypothetical protein